MQNQLRISGDGWASHNIWEHSAAVLDLYRRRARDEAEEMICAAQAAELLAEVAQPGETLLDAGCGTGYFYHSLRSRTIALEYHGLDATEAEDRSFDLFWPWHTTNMLDLAA